MAISVLREGTLDFFIIPSFCKHVFTFVIVPVFVIKTKEAVAIQKHENKLSKCKITFLVEGMKWCNIHSQKVS